MPTCWLRARPTCLAFLCPVLTQLGVDGGAEDPSLRPFWRGRMGLSKEEQLQLYEQVRRAASSGAVWHLMPRAQAACDSFV